MKSPFKFRVVDGFIVQIDKRTDSVHGKLDVTDIQGVCNAIATLDSALWATMGALSSESDKHKVLIAAIEDALNT